MTACFETACNKCHRNFPIALLSTARCVCGKLYHRCQECGGEKGAKKSLNGHLSLTECGRAPEWVGTDYDPWVVR